MSNEREKCAERLGLRLHPALRSAINDAAESEFVPVSTFIRQAVVEKLRAKGVQIQVREVA